MHFIVEQDTRSLRNVVMISFRSGSSLIKPEEQGAGALLANILNEGPEGMTGNEFRKRLFLLGAELNYVVSAPSATISILAPTDNLDEAIKLALDTLKKPKFDRKTYQLAYARVESDLAQREDDMYETLSFIALRDAFAYHPNALDGSPSRLSLKNLDLEKVKAKLPILFDPRYLITAGTGPVEPKTLQKLLNDTLGAAGYLSQAVEERKFDSSNVDIQASKDDTTKVVLVNRPGATDNQLLYLTRRKIPVDDGDFIALELANILLGGSVQSALFKVLRIERGLTYSVSSSVREDLGYWRIHSFATTDKLASLMTGIEEVVKAQARVKVDGEMSQLIKAELLTYWKNSRELPSDRLRSVLSTKIYGRDLEFQETMDQWITKAPTSTITKIGRKYFNLDTAKIYIMGDKDKLGPILKAQGYKEKEIKIIDPASFL